MTRRASRDEVTSSAPGGRQAGGLLAPVRIAVYAEAAREPHGREDGPRVVEVCPEGDDFLRRVADLVTEEIRGAGGAVPAGAIREVVENLVHASCAGATISILEGGQRVVVADQGAGIRDPQRALTPGYSSASEEARRYIRGVGAGLPIAAAAAAAAGVALRIDTNIGGGTVVILDATGHGSPSRPGQLPPLTEREKRALVLLHELGRAGPSELAHELHVALSTAHRTLMALQQRGLVASDARGKRALTESGVAELGLIFVA